MATMTTPDYTVEIIETLQGFKEIQKDWERLVTLKKEIPLFFSFEVFMIYYEIILNNFTNIKINIFVVRNNNQKIIAIFPFTYEPKIFPSFLSFREIAIKDEYLIGFYYFLIDPGENQELVFQRFLEYLKRKKRKWDIIKVYSIPEDEQLIKVFTSIAGKFYKIDEYETKTLIIDCEREFDEYIKNDIDEKDLNRLKRKYRRLESKGTVTLVKLRKEGEVEKGLAYFYDIEDSGWKGKEGTSLKRSYYGMYYKELASRLSEVNKFRLYLLQLNNKYIAGIYAIIDRGILYLIKTGYLDEFARDSPSNVLYYLLFEQLFKYREIRKIDFYGSFSGYHRTLGKHTRKRYNVTICNMKVLPIIYYIVLKVIRRFGYPFPEDSLRGKMVNTLTKTFL